MGTRKYNFNPGPATLPLSVLEKIQQEMVDYHDLGMSVLEISHRSPEFTQILQEAKQLLAELMGIPDDYAIIFAQGGASLQFVMIPMNLMQEQQGADYILTGTWSQKAYKEAQRFGPVHCAANTEEDGLFRRIPRLEELQFSDKAAYVHLTSNNTIFGTQWHQFPETGAVPLIADMSSDILSRQLDVRKFALIYAGAQKNLGPAGVTVVILKKELLERCQSQVPTLLAYKTYVDKDSVFNTPPVFAIYVFKLVLEWVKQSGGLPQIERINRQKAELVYATMDKWPTFFKGTAEKESRSWMNVTLRLPSEELEQEFIAQAAARNFHGLKGHRSVKGIRISMYNAMGLEGIEKLTAFMTEFAEQHAS